ncbi:hypothetical protein FHR32_002217 [Streptosporangium album]|uniref:Uncharacterized protein n=1 Tax=Streptosporangium album TaxID=47479 RepID=A0A7W7RU14_9ACTN|nr:hypothetical protein [Streptosporangium album]MBB4937912.1 hypothetical protein [Streptosporangium album]
MINDIDRIVAGIAPDPGPGMTPGARELFDEITTAPAVAPGRFHRWFATRPARRWSAGRPVSPARRFAVPIVAGLATAAMALGWVLPGGYGTSPASAALDIRQEGDYYVITVKDLYADPESYERELQARGIGITLSVDSAPSSLDGRMMVMDPQADGLSNAQQQERKDLITTTDRAGACYRPEVSCPIGLRVPVAYKGRAEISLARKGRPGEMYRLRVSLAAPGEPLHCVAFVNRTLDEVRPLLQKRGIGLKFVGNEGTPASVPGSWYVHDGVLESATSALMLVSPTRKKLAPPEAEFAPENQCEKGTPEDGQGVGTS